MSRRAEALVWDLEADLDATEKWVLSALAYMHNDQTGDCWPSVGYLAQRCRLSPNQTRTVLQHLETKGHITIVPRYTGKGSRSSNQYFLACLGPGHGQLSPRLFEDDPTPATGGPPSNEPEGGTPATGVPTPTIGVPPSSPTSQESGNESGNESGKEKGNEHSGSRAGQKKDEGEPDPDSGARESAFATALTRQLEPTEIDSLFGEDGGIEIVGHVVRLKLCAPPNERQAKVLLRVAQAAGCSGWESA